MNYPTFMFFFHVRNGCRLKAAAKPLHTKEMTPSSGEVYGRVTHIYWLLVGSLPPRYFRDGMATLRIHSTRLSAPVAAGI